MTFHLAGFSESLDPEGSYANIAALADERLFTQNDDLRVPVLNNVIGVMGWIDDTVVTSALRLDSPTIKRHGYEYITPVNSLVTEGASTFHVAYMNDTPIVLGVDEILRAQTNSNPAAAAQHLALLMFADGAQAPANAAETITARVNATGTANPNQWTLFQTSIESELPPGNYAITGMAAIAADLYAARIVLRTGDQWRPGVPGQENIGSAGRQIFRHGRLGQWGTFPFTQPPFVEVLASSAVNSVVVYWDLIQVG